MSLPDRFGEAVTTRTRAVLVAFVLVTALLGAGLPALEGDASLGRFESGSREADSLEYARTNFGDGERTTTVQVVVRGENVLSRESLLESLALQRDIREHEDVDGTLVEGTPVLGVENVVATTVIREREAADLTERADELERRADELEATGDRLRSALDEIRERQYESERLAAARERGDVSDEEYGDRAEELETEIDRAVDRATRDLDAEGTRRFERAVANLRAVERATVELDREYETGEIDEGTYDRRSADLESDATEVYADGTVGVLADEYDRLRAERDRLERERETLYTAEQPPLSDQVAALEELDDDAYEAAVERALSEDGPGGSLAMRLLPSSYESGSTEADARLLVVTQSLGDGEIDDSIVDGQRAVRDLATASADSTGEDDSTWEDDSTLVVGAGIVSDEIDRSTADSLVLVSPLALLFVVGALLFAYRDPIDVALGVAGTCCVVLWTLGVAGWAGIAFSQLFVAVPVLLIGLSIDYAIHVFMRHRERREGGDGDGTVRGSMAGALAGVGVALVWVTLTTAVGFLSNLVSPIAPLREFGAVSAVGICAALVVFGVAIPAAKVEVDELLERRGFDRRRRAFATGGGRCTEALAAGAIAARRAPFAVLAVVLLVTAGGVYGAAQVDTSFDRSDFLAEEPPAWTESLPAPFAPGEYGAKADVASVEKRFQQRGAPAQLVVRGDVTDGETLTRAADAREAAIDGETTFSRTDGGTDVRSPLTLMERVAAEDESFNATFSLADRTGDGVPDQNLEGLYDELFEIEPEAASEVIVRTDGEYEAVRLVVPVRGDADPGKTTAEIRVAAAAFDAEGAERWTVVATGDPVVTHVAERDVLATVVESLLLTLAVVFAFLTIAYRATGRGASLGAVTLVPVAFVLAWILGTMSVLDLSFNVLTGTVASLTIGLGVAYSIHVSSRYALELDRRGNVRDALDATVAGTGGALLGSAATTVGGFGVLAVATLPVLRQFGLVTALTIAYAFLASVVVLPTLLVLWTRYLGPDVAIDPPMVRERRGRPAGDGGESVGGECDAGERDGGKGDAGEGDVPDDPSVPETG